MSRYDPCWDQATAQFAHELNIPAIRGTVERACANAESQRAYRTESLNKLKEWRDYENDPRCRAHHPLLIDSNLVELAEIIRLAPLQMSAWLKPVYDELARIAYRTKPLRETLLHVQPAPTHDLC